ncbi:MAG: hypothetical protein QXD62_03735 [Candidatus Woesearchaeota archaeon]
MKKKDENSDISFGEKIKIKIAEKITSLISQIFEKAITFSFDSIKEKIIEIENHITSFVNEIIMLSLVKATFLIVSIIFFALAISTSLVKVLPLDVSFLLVGSMFALIGILIGPRKIKN